jgi:hypothetical protein
MATVAALHRTPAKDDRFFLISSIVMALTIFAGFSLQLGMGRSSFSSPPIVHAHALVFMGWVVLYLLQNVFVATGAIGFHKRLGWIGAGWMVAMLVLGTIVTLRLVRMGQAPFFFTPIMFMVMDPLSVLTFVCLSFAAIVLRRRTGWHRRLHYSGMSILLGPALGRLLPMPLLIPFAYEVDFLALLIFPAAGIVADLRRTGRVHPAWWWGLGTIVGSTVLIEAIVRSPIGTAIYHGVTAGTPGAAVAGGVYPPWPRHP